MLLSECHVGDKVAYGEYTPCTVTAVGTELVLLRHDAADCEWATRPCNLTPYVEPWPEPNVNMDRWLLQYELPDGTYRSVVLVEAYPRAPRDAKRHRLVRYRLVEVT